MTRLCFATDRTTLDGTAQQHSAPIANVIDQASQMMKPSTDAFLESVASALAKLYNAESVHVVPKPTAFFFAHSFLRAIGDGPRVSRIGMDSDGEPVLEWQSGMARKLTLSFSDEGDISFAGHIAENCFFGNERYDGTPSETIMSLLEQAGSSPKRD